MNCAVTAGPTFEPLDTVRRLTNFSTGRLGTQLADYLVDQGHEVVLLRGSSSTFRTASKAARVIEFGTASDLERHLESLASTRMDAVFHAAAVNDFGFGKVWRRSSSGELHEISRGKFSTREAPLVAELLPVPKLINRLRGWFPDAWLVGWKYEVDGTRSTAVDRARTQFVESQTDACVVNGPAYGSGFGHLSKDSELLHLENSAALFECLERFMRR
ncbi:MAG: NAD-dependent epimerase/dehydratase family protein [Verrucomicrobia bacterium]|nr:NAD-dependent epimerase/dehydratase family protein [Verrucomicrobiota bacterium]